MRPRPSPPQKERAGPGTPARSPLGSLGPPAALSPPTFRVPPTPTLRPAPSPPPSAAPAPHLLPAASGLLGRGPRPPAGQRAPGLRLRLRARPTTLAHGPRAGRAAGPPGGCSCPAPGTSRARPLASRRARAPGRPRHSGRAPLGDTPRPSAPRLGVPAPPRPAPARPRPPGRKRARSGRSGPWTGRRWRGRSFCRASASGPR